MKEHPSSFKKSVISIALRALICFSFLRASSATTSFCNIDLSTQTLDPPTTGFMIAGNFASDSFGYSVRATGDVNNDGYDDIIASAYRKDNNQGAVYVIYGGEKSKVINLDLSKRTLDPLTTGFMITGGVVGDEFGYSISEAGDINKDGYDDIIVGAVYKKNSQGASQGAAYVIYGGPKSAMTNIDLSFPLDPLTTGFMITGNANDQLGWSVSIAGDFNNDGYKDIIVSAGDKTPYVIYGGPKSAMRNIDLSTTTLDPQTTGFMITGPASSSFGVYVSTAGDINKDGYDDIIIGSTFKNSGQGAAQGAAYVIYGRSKSTMTNIDLSTLALDPLNTGFMIIGNAAGDALGFPVTTAGDINNDGYDDIIVGASSKNSGQGASQGAVYVIYGGPKSTMTNIDLSIQALDPLTTGFMITGNSGGDYFGGSASKVGDINNDGYDDMIVGAFFKDGGQGVLQGVAYVIYGGKKSAMTNIALSTQTLDPLTTGFVITGPASSVFGRSVSAGDINKDGYNEIIVGAPNKNSGQGSSQGAVYVFYAGSMCSSCPTHCDQCSSPSVCTKCTSPYLLYQSQCLSFCPDATFTYISTCQDCPSYCSSCTSQQVCKTCYQGYTLSSSLCVLSSSSSSYSSSNSDQAQGKAIQATSSAAKVIGSVVSVGSATAPLASLVSKTVQNTRYLNLSVTSELSEVYQTWDTDLISWDVPNVFSNADHFKTSPSLFSRYDLDSPFLVNFWPTLLNIGIAFTTFITCFALQKFFNP